LKTYGNYTPGQINGKTAVNPVSFVLENWALLCQLVGLNPKPAINVQPGSGNTDAQSSFPMLYFPAEDTVRVYTSDLESDYLAAGMSGDGLNQLVFLWAHPCLMIRYALRNRGIIQTDDFIDIETVRTFDWPDAVVKSRFSPSALPPQNDPTHAGKCDDMTIQIAIMGYLVNRGLKKLHDERIKAILCAKRSSIDKRDFELVPSKKWS